MKSTIAIYLAGSIKKAHEKADETFWTDSDRDFLQQNLQPFEVSFLNPAFRTDNLSDQLSVFGRDMLQVFSSDIVFVDARDRRGLGVGAEMMWAKVNQIPVVTWAPKNSHYNRENTTILDVPVARFIHPFVEQLSDKLVENLQEGAEWIRSVQSKKTVIKGIEHMAIAMQYYKDRQLEHDLPMKALIDASEKLKHRINQTPQVVL